MSTKLGRVVTYGQKTPSTKSGDLLRGHVANEKNSYLHFHDTYGNKLGRVVTYGRGPHQHVSFSSCGHARNENPYNCISTIPIVSKFGRVVT